MFHLAAVTVVLLLLWGCNTYDSSLLEAGVPEATAVGGSGGTQSTANSNDTQSSADSSATSSDGTTSGTSEASAAAATTDSAGGSAGTRADGGSGGGAAGADGTPTAVTGTTAGGDGASGGSGGAGGSSASGGNGGSGGSGGCGAADCCPDNPDKLGPGQCGCDTPDTDTDADGTADCSDLCPEDAVKTQPGECGCGVRDEDTSGGVGCLGLRNGLVHRYSFSGEGTEALDTQGEASAEVVGTVLDGSGAVTLVAADVAQYIDVPPGLVSALANASLEAWFIWDGGPQWVRLIDFGSTIEGIPGEPGTGDSFITMTPNGATGPSYPYVAFNPPGTDAEVSCSGTGALTTGVLHHVAITLDTQSDALTLYIDGMLACAKALPLELAAIDDVNCWLGRSQFAADVGFSGSIDEFRIYDVALTASQVAFSYQAGPDPEFL